MLTEEALFGAALYASVGKKRNWNRSISAAVWSSAPRRIGTYTRDNMCRWRVLHAFLGVTIS